jgi:hypothetical protein
MAYTTLKSSPQLELYKSYEGNKTTALDRRASYQMEEVALDLLRAQSSKTGKYLNPTAYDGLILKLQNLLKTPMSATKRQDILAQIERYNIAKDTLIERVSKEVEGKEPSVENIKYAIQNRIDEQLSQNKNVNADSPLDYAKNAMDILLRKDEEGNLVGALVDLEQEITQKEEDSQYPNAGLRDYYKELMNKYKDYRGIAQDPNLRSQFSIVVKPNAYGEWEDFDFVKTIDAPKQGFQQLGDLTMENMPVLFQATSKDELGNLKTVLPDGTTIVSDGDIYQLPKGTDPISLFGGAQRALDYHPQAGDFVRVDNRDIYLYGGLKGDKKEFQHIADPQTMVKLGLWEKMNSMGGPRRDFTANEFKDLAEMVGEPIDKKYLLADRKSELMESLKAESDALRDFEATAMFPTTIRPSTGFLTTPHTFADVGAGLTKLGKATVIAPLEAQATGQQKFIEGAKEIYKSAPSWIQKGVSFVKGAFKGPLE